jgi:thiol-disulfide isomerase/thioredoxin
MKKIATLFGIVLTTISCSNAQEKQFSEKALQGKLTTTEGKVVSFESILEENKGKNLVIEVWASWCGDCVKAMPKVKELQANNPDVTYVFISADKAMDKWKEGIAKHELQGNHYWIDDKDGMKGSFGKSIDLDWIPRYIVVDKTGKVLLYRAIETDFDKINNTLNP